MLNSITFESQHVFPHVTNMTMTYSEYVLSKEGVRTSSVPYASSKGSNVTHSSCAIQKPQGVGVILTTCNEYCRQHSHCQDFM